MPHIIKNIKKQYKKDYVAQKNWKVTNNHLNFRARKIIIRETQLLEISRNFYYVSDNDKFDVELKLKQFLGYGPKPKPPDMALTLCISYSSKNIDFHIQKMIKQIKIKALECLIYSPLILNRQKINLIQGGAAYSYTRIVGTRDKTYVSLRKNLRF